MASIRIPTPSQISDTPDNFTEKYLGLKSLELDNKIKEENLQARKHYAKRIFNLIFFWLCIMLLLVFFQGIRCIPYFAESFQLSDSVMITLITTTTANVLGLFLIVANYFFNVGKPILPIKGNSSRTRKPSGSRTTQ